VGGPIAGAILGGALVGAGMTSAEMGGLFTSGPVDWNRYANGILIGAASGAVGGALGLAGGALFGTSIAGMALTGLISGLGSNAVAQWVGMGLDPTQQWSWSSFIFAGIGGALGGAATGLFTRNVINASGQVICGTTAAQWFGAHALGGALGGFIGDAAGQIGNNLQQHGLNFSQWTWDWGSSARATAMGAAMGVAGAYNGWRGRVCFAAGTRLLTPTGDKAIEEFVPGDLLLSRPEGDPGADLEGQEVEAVFVSTGRILHLHVGGQVIRTTGEHPFWVKGFGWVPACQLEEGDLLSSHDGQWVAVEEQFETGEYETVYNLRVAECHTYFVGSRQWGFSVWAHNTYQEFRETVTTGQNRLTDEQARYAYYEVSRRGVGALEGYLRENGLNTNKVNRALRIAISDERIPGVTQASERLWRETWREAQRQAQQGLLNDTRVVEGAMHLESGQIGLGRSGDYQSHTLNLPPQREPYLPGVCGMPHAVDALVTNGALPSGPILVTGGGFRCVNGEWYFVTPCRNCVGTMGRNLNLVATPLPPGVQLPAGVNPANLPPRAAYPFTPPPGW
jgi:hypothetical protein